MSIVGSWTGVWPGGPPCVCAGITRPVSTAGCGFSSSCPVIFPGFSRAIGKKIPVSCRLFDVFSSRCHVLESFIVFICLIWLIISIGVFMAYFLLIFRRSRIRGRRSPVKPGKSSLLAQKHVPVHGKRSGICRKKGFGYLHGRRELEPKGAEPARSLPRMGWVESSGRIKRDDR